MKFFQSIKKPSFLFIRIYQFLFNLIGLLPVNKRLVIFESFLGKQYSCNPRAIFEYLMDHHPEYKLIWSIDKTNKQNFEKLGIPYIKRFSMKWLFLMPRAKYWVSNSRMPYWVKKPRNTIYLQTWHGTPLKKLGADIEEIHMPGTTTEQYKENFFKESSNWDYLISPNRYSTDIFSQAFNVPVEKVLETGYPRNDDLMNNNNLYNMDIIKKSLGIPKEKKVILYAPTWRDDEYFDKGKYKFSLQIDLSLLQNALKEDYVILLRLHYLIANKIDTSKYNGFVYDFSNHLDIRELYLISDLLITDYSSVFFDYLCLKRPIIFYTYDIDLYRDKLRGFYFDFENDAPGPLVRTTEDLIKEINKVESNKTYLSEDINRFNNKFCQLENGNSTKHVVNSVFLERATK